MTQDNSPLGDMAGMPSKDTERSYDATLENWSMTETSKGVVRYHGNIYGDKKGRFQDGDSVTTSPAVAHYHSDNSILTANSLYKLGAKARGHV